MSSTTFDAQLDVAARVAGENPDLYYEIQSLNAYGEESLRALRGRSNGCTGPCTSTTRRRSPR